MIRGFRVQRAAKRGPLSPTHYWLSLPVKVFPEEVLPVKVNVTAPLGEMVTGPVMVASFSFPVIAEIVSNVMVMVPVKVPPLRPETLAVLLVTTKAPLFVFGVGWMVPVTVAAAQLPG